MRAVVVITGRAVIALQITLKLTMLGGELDHLSDWPTKRFGLLIHGFELPAGG